MIKYFNTIKYNLIYNNYNDFKKNKFFIDNKITYPIYKSISI